MANDSIVQYNVNDEGLKMAKDRARTVQRDAPNHFSCRFEVRLLP